MTGTNCIIGHMDHNRIPDFRQYIEGWSSDLELLRQNRLLDESEFIRFSRDRGLAISGVVTGDPGGLHKRDWLTSDGTDYKSSPLFHPFRIYPLHQTLEACKLNIPASVSLHKARELGFGGQLQVSFPNINQPGEAARERNRVADLAILLEPVYWPRITERRSVRSGTSESDHKASLGQYSRKVLGLVGTLIRTFGWRDMSGCASMRHGWMTTTNCIFYSDLQLGTNARR